MAHNIHVCVLMIMPGCPLLFFIDQDSFAHFEISPDDDEIVFKFRRACTYYTYCYYSGSVLDYDVWDKGK